MSLFNLIEQHDGVGVASHPFSKLSALVIAYISRRCTHQARGVETLAVFAHVDAYEGIGRAEHAFCQFLGQIGFAHTRRSQEHECTDGMVGLFQAYAVALYGLDHLLDGTVLRYDSIFQFGGHVSESKSFRFGNALHRHAGHHRHDISHIFGGDVVASFRFAVGPGLLHLSEFRLLCRLPVTVACSEFKVLVSDGSLLLFLDECDFLFQCQDFGGHLCMFQKHAGAHLVEGIDGFVGEISVGDIPFCQFDTCHDGLVVIFHMVMPFVSVLDVVKNGHGLFRCCGFYHHFLETSFQCPVFLDGFAVFIKCGGSNTLYGASCQSRFQYVGSVHGARS